MSPYFLPIVPALNTHWSSPVAIGIAVTPEERKEIYHLRYKVYVDEILYSVPIADHDGKMLYDELDEWGLLLYAKAGSTIVGTLRLNIGIREAFSAEFSHVFQLDRFQTYRFTSDEALFAYASKGMILPAYRSSPVLNLLLAKSYEIYTATHVPFCFVNSNFYLISLHEHYGNHRYGSNFSDPSLGPMAPSVLLIDDIAHLRAVKSPLYDLAKKRRQVDVHIADWFHAEFPEAASMVNSQLISKSALWTLLSARLGQAPHQAIPLLSGLSVAQAKLFLHACGIIVSCKAQEPLMTRGDRCHEVTILLSGAVSAVGSASSSPVLPGRHFGGIGLVQRTSHPVSMQTTTDSELLLLSHHSFPRFSRKYPEIAAKIVQNLPNSYGCE